MSGFLNLGDENSFTFSFFCYVFLCRKRAYRNYLDILAEYVQNLKPGGSQLAGNAGRSKKWGDALEALDFDKNCEVSAIRFQVNSELRLL